MYRTIFFFTNLCEPELAHRLQISKMRRNWTSLDSCQHDDINIVTVGVARRRWTAPLKPRRPCVKHFTTFHVLLKHVSPKGDYFTPKDHFFAPYGYYFAHWCEKRPFSLSVNGAQTRVLHACVKKNIVRYMRPQSQCALLGLWYRNTLFSNHFRTVTSHPKGKHSWYCRRIKKSSYLARNWCCSTRSTHDTIAHIRCVTSALWHWYNPLEPKFQVRRNRLPIVIRAPSYEDSIDVFVGFMYILISGEVNWLNIILKVKKKIYEVICLLICGSMSGTVKWIGYSDITNCLYTFWRRNKNKIKWICVKKFLLNADKIV